MYAIPAHVVDTHCHVISSDNTLFPITTPMGGKQSDWSKERPVSDSGMTAAMKAGGVSKSVLVQASTCYGHDNRYVAQSVAHHPEAFAGVFSVDLVSPQSVEQIAHWMEQGLSGVRVFIAGHTAQDQTLQIDDPRADALWEYVSSHGIPICVQLRSFGLAALATVLKRHPKLTVLLDHFARPELEDGAPYAQYSRCQAWIGHARVFYQARDRRLWTFSHSLGLQFPSLLWHLGRTTARVLGGHPGPEPIRPRLDLLQNRPCFVPLFEPGDRRCLKPISANEQ